MGGQENSWSTLDYAEETWLSWKLHFTESSFLYSSRLELIKRETSTRSEKQWSLPLECIWSQLWWWVDADITGWSQLVLALLGFVSSLFSWMLFVNINRSPSLLPCVGSVSAKMVTTQSQQFSTDFFFIIIFTSSYPIIPPSYVAMLAFSFSLWTLTCQSVTPSVILWLSCQIFTSLVFSSIM